MLTIATVTVHLEFINFKIYVYARIRWPPGFIQDVDLQQWVHMYMSDSPCSGGFQTLMMQPAMGDVGNDVSLYFSHRSGRARRGRS